MAVCQSARRPVKTSIDGLATSPNRGALITDFPGNLGLLVKIELETISIKL